MKLLLLTLLLLLVPSAALGDVARDLVISADALRSDEPRVRVEAAERLSSLARTDLPAIDARIEALKRRRIDPEEGYQALRSFAHAAGSRRADDTLDIEPGIKAELERARPSPVEAAIAEELLLLRSLEKLRSAEAYRRAVRIFGLHYDVFRWESRHSSRRMGVLAMPALLDGAAYGDAGLAEWASQSLEALGKPSPAEALRALEGENRAELLRTYAERRIMDAMESVAAFLDDPDPIVRKAAATSLRRYGRNAIWQIRDAALLFLGEELDRSWGAQQSLEHVIDKLEARRLAPQREALARAVELAARGELDEARQLLDVVLSERPKMERRGVAADVYEALAIRAEGERRLADAARFYRKAALITADGERARALDEAAEEARTSLAIERGEFAPRLLELAREDADAERDATSGHDEGSGSYVPAALLGLGILLMMGLGPFRALRSALRAGRGLAGSFAGPRLGRLARHARRRALGFVARARTLARSTRAVSPSEHEVRETSTDARTLPPRRRSPAPPPRAAVPLAASGGAKVPVELIFGSVEPKRREER